MRLLKLGIVIVLLSTVLAACSRNMGRIEAETVENGEHGRYWHTLTASTNCLEVGEEVVFTAHVVNEGREALSIVDTPPLDILVRPSTTDEPVMRWSETDQYPKYLNPVLEPGERRTYSWRWTAHQQYVAAKVRLSGIRVTMPLTLGFAGGGKVQSPLPPIVVGVKLHPQMGNMGAWCKDIPR